KIIYDIIGDTIFAAARRSPIAAQNVAKIRILRPGITTNLFSAAGATGRPLKGRSSLAGRKFYRDYSLMTS
ncbi:hypothetical protein ALC56_08295, partial [Trachymyrmex septentrionalis]